MATLSFQRPPLLRLYSPFIHFFSISHSFTLALLFPHLAVEGVLALWVFFFFLNGKGYSPPFSFFFSLALPFPPLAVAGLPALWVFFFFGTERDIPPIHPSIATPHHQRHATRLSTSFFFGFAFALALLGSIYWDMTKSRGQHTTRRRDKDGAMGRKNLTERFFFFLFPTDLRISYILSPLTMTISA